MYVHRRQFQRFPLLWLHWFCVSRPPPPDSCGARGVHMRASVDAICAAMRRLWNAFNTRLSTCRQTHGSVAPDVLSVGKRVCSARCI